MSSYQNERAFLRAACREVDEAAEVFRWSASVTVRTAQTMHERGEDVPVSGDAGTRWLKVGTA